MKALASAILGMFGAGRRTPKHSKNRKAPITVHDIERLNKAIAKRQRKAARKEAP